MVYKISGPVPPSVTPRECKCELFLKIKLLKVVYFFNSHVIKLNQWLGKYLPIERHFN
jgi:hypothetical protein